LRLLLLPLFFGLDSLFLSLADLLGFACCLFGGLLGLLPSLLFGLGLLLLGSLVLASLRVLGLLGLSLRILLVLGLDLF
jgi:hypothetical protein